MTRAEYNEKVYFLALALIYAAIICTRVIPDISSSNDAGRYVNNILNKVQSPQYKFAERIYYGLISFLFDGNTIRLYFFLTAIIVPLVLTFSSKWENLDFLIACGVLFSVYFLDLTTNALRECLALSLFMCSIKASSKVSKVLFLILAALIHYFVLIYLPLMVLYWLRKKPLRIHIIIATAVVLVALAFGMDEIRKWFEFFSTIYMQRQKYSFVLFMILPIAFLCCSMGASRFRGPAFYFGIYLLALLLVCLLFFPYITYRITLSGFVILLSLMMDSQDFPSRLKLAVPIISISQLFFYCVTSSNVRLLWFHPI